MEWEKQKTIQQNANKPVCPNATSSISLSFCIVHQFWAIISFHFILCLHLLLFYFVFYCIFSCIYVYSFYSVYVLSVRLFLRTIWVVFCLRRGNFFIFFFFSHFILFFWRKQTKFHFKVPSFLFLHVIYTITTTTSLCVLAIAWFLNKEYLVLNFQLLELYLDWKWLKRAKNQMKIYGEK